MLQPIAIKCVLTEQEGDGYDGQYLVGNLQGWDDEGNEGSQTRANGSAEGQDGGNGPGPPPNRDTGAVGKERAFGDSRAGCDANLAHRSVWGTRIPSSGHYVQ